MARKRTAKKEPGGIAEQLKSLAVPITDLRFDPSNARNHPRENIELLKTSLRLFGQRKPLIVQKSTGIVHAGNGLLQAAKELGWREVAAIFTDDSDSVARAFAIADNRTGDLSEFDDRRLADLMLSLDLKELDIDHLSALGFSRDEIAELLEELPEPEPKKKKSFQHEYECPKCGHVWTTDAAGAKRKAKK